ncbi:MAG: hypothetical protein ABIJ97_11515 [Bacteroidota bacterium]
MELKNIELSREHYRMLLKLVYLGKWMYTFNNDDVCRDSDPVEQLIFSFTKDFNSEDMVLYKKELDSYFPTKEFQEEIYSRVEIFYEDIFHDELIHHLAKRDMYKEHGKTKIDKLSKIKYIDLLYKYTLRYTEEYEKYGVDRFEINSSKKPKH